jgi:hypothetical protein
MGHWIDPVSRRVCIIIFGGLVGWSVAARDRQLVMPVVSFRQAGQGICKA